MGLFTRRGRETTTPTVENPKRSVPPFQFNYRLPWQHDLFVYGAWLLGILAIVISLWTLGRQFVVPHPQLDESRQVVANQAIDQIVQEVCEKARGTAGSDRLSKVEVVHFANDPTDYFSKNLRAAFARQGRFDVGRPSWKDRFLSVFGINNDGCDDRKSAEDALHNGEADGFIWGRVDELSNEREGSTIKVRYELFDRHNGEVFCKNTIAHSTVPDRIVRQGPGSGSVAEGSPVVAQYAQEPSVASAASRTAWHIRFLWFLIVMLLLPVCTISFIRAMVAKKSNRVNAFTLCIYMVVDLILAFFMIGGVFLSVFSVLIFIAAGLVSFAYNVKLLSFAVKLEE